MNDQWGYDNTNDASQGENLDGPKALRDAYKALKAQNDELNSKLTSFLEDQTKQKLSGVFESLGVPGAAQVYQGEPDPEKAKQWVETMRGVFAGNAQGNPAQEFQEQSGLEPDAAAQLQRMTEAGQHGVPMGNIEIAASNLGSVTSTDDIVALMRKLSNGG